MNEADPAEVLAQGRFLRVLRRSGWEWVERTNTSAAVVIAAITPQRELVLIEQYRIPLDKRVVELPAGLVGDSADCRNEGLLEAARRELFEETGFEAASFQYLLDGPSSSGLTNEVFTLMLAEDAKRVGPGGGDASEQIQVHVVPIEGIDAWLESKRRNGRLVSPKIYAAIYFIAGR